MSTSSDDPTPREGSVPEEAGQTAAPQGWRAGPPQPGAPHRWQPGPPQTDASQDWRPGPPPWVRQRMMAGHQMEGRAVPAHLIEARRKRGRKLFIRLGMLFGVMFLLVVGGLGALAYLLTNAVGGNGHIAMRVWALGCFFVFVLPLLAIAIGAYAFRRVAMPLGDMMNAADMVAQGDLSVRVPARGPGEFSQFATSFNRMVAELQRADQYRRNMTADIAHELRTPLHIIQGNLEGILDGVYEPTPDHLNATLDETRTLSRLVEELRTLSLAEAGQLSMNREAVDLNDVVADVATSFSGQAEQHQVTLHTKLPTESLVVWGDAGRLDQILSNLVANALRHTPQGGSITLSATRTPASEEKPPAVRLTVQDTGEGIAEEDLPYIFDRFWRGDVSRTRTAGTGSGLGLAIVRQLVQAHGGQIDVASVPGEGTTFTIVLPEGETFEA